MAKISGQNLIVQWIYSGGTVTLDTIRNFESSAEQESADATAGSDAYRNYVKTVKSRGASGEVIMKDYANGGSALRAAMAEGNSGTLLWGVEGTATGSPKHGFSGFISNSTEASPFDDVDVLNIEWMMNAGTMLYNGVTDKW